jgi:hypothetical protein
LKNTKILFSKSTNKVKDNQLIILSDVLSDIKSSPINQALITLKRQAKYNKSDLPVIYFSVSALKINHRNNKNVSQHSGIIVIDIDNLEDNIVTDVRSKLTKDKYVLSVFYSPSKQLKVLFKVKPDLTNHLVNYINITDYLEEQYPELITQHPDKKIIDPSGKNIARACYISYDPDIYINYKCELFDLVFDSKKVDKPKVKGRGKVIRTDVHFSNNQVDDRVDDGTGEKFNYYTRLKESCFKDVNIPVIISEGIPYGYVFRPKQPVIKKGSRHIVMGAVTIVMIYNNRGRSSEKIIGLACGFSDRYFNPPLLHKEVEKIFNSNYKRFHDGQMNINDLVTNDTLTLRQTFWSRNCTLSNAEKTILGRRMRQGVVDDKRLDDFALAFTQLLGFEQKFSGKEISNRLGISYKTLYRLLEDQTIDLKSIKVPYNKAFKPFKKEFDLVLSEVDADDYNVDLEDVIRWRLVPQEYHFDYEGGNIQEEELNEMLEILNSPTSKAMSE